MKNELEIIYATNTRLPTEKAHGLATMRICEAFGRLGARVMVIAPWRFNKIKEEPFAYYRSPKNFSLKKVPSLDLFFLRSGSRAVFYLQYFSFIFSAIFYLILFRFSSFRRAIFFSHDHLPLFFLSFFTSNIFYDIHDFPSDNIFYRRVLKKARGISVQTKWKINELNSRFGAPKEKIVYWPNGTDVAYFSQTISRETAREKLALPLDKKIAVYTGHLFGWKGVDTLAGAAVFLPADVLVYLVGGTAEDAAAYRKKTGEQKNIILTGFRPHAEILYWLKAADCLVLPNTGKEDISSFYTSPMKLFEYLAAGRPIVASRLPSIMEIVSEETAVLIEPDNPEKLADGIRNILADPERAERLAKAGQEISRQYTWEKRAGVILGLMRESRK